MTSARPEEQARPASLFPLPAILIAAAAFAVISPMLFRGIPSGHDFEFHLDSWMEVLGQWRQGIFYPRWAALAHYGYGEARFIFYPPASWTLGALLGAIVPWRFVPGIFDWIVLAGAGCSMFVLARRWLPRNDAIFAAVLYVANPYNLVIVYWRSADAELLAGAFLPLVLLFTLEIAEEGRKAIVPLALVILAAWLTNAPSAVMVNYSVALLVVVIAVIQRSARPLLYGAVSILLGAALAGFYLLPAAYEEKWVNISEVLSPGVRPQDNFLFTVINDPDHNRFNLLVSIVACGEMLIVAGAVLVSRTWKRERPVLWWCSVLWALASSVLMISWTFFFWEHLPKLRFVQLPWRWLLCLNVGLALLMTMGFRHWRSRVLLYSAMLLVIVGVWHRVQQPWWDHSGDITEIRDDVREGRGYEGTDEYVPSGADPYEIKREAVRVSATTRDVRLRVEKWDPESRIISAEATAPTKLVLKLFNYPAWKVTVNSRQVVTETEEQTGRMIIPIPAGRNVVNVIFGRTWDRMLGWILSVVAAVAIAVFVFFGRRKSIEI